MLYPEGREMRPFAAASVELFYAPQRDPRLARNISNRTMLLNRQALLPLGIWGLEGGSGSAPGCVAGPT